ncbi:MAG TPA: RNA polymerase sigma factor [Bradyrhizobium sp.]|nr:RNA polymerase sigma factor [Bradyrhizobium sp.]
MFDKKQRFVSEIFAHNKRNLLGYLKRRVGPDDASDLLQETFVRVLRHDQFDTIVDPAAFLKQIAINLTRDFARRRKVEASYLKFGDPPENAPSDDARLNGHIDADDESRVLRDAFNTLPPRRCEVLALHLHENLSLDEIARRLDISDRMVRKHLSLALRSCRTALRNSSD